MVQQEDMKTLFIRIQDYIHDEVTKVNQLPNRGQKRQISMCYVRRKWKHYLLKMALSIIVMMRL